MRRTASTASPRPAAIDSAGNPGMGVGKIVRVVPVAVGLMGVGLVGEVVICKVAVALLDWPPDEHETVMVKVPMGVAEVVLTVSTAVAEPPAGGVIGVRLNMPVAPEGRLVTERSHGELKLPIEVTVTV